MIRSLRQAVTRLQTRDGDLAKQLRRAASSVPLNLGEGRRRAGKDRLHLWRIAGGSACGSPRPGATSPATRSPSRWRSSIGCAQPPGSSPTEPITGRRPPGRQCQRPPHWHRRRRRSSESAPTIGCGLRLEFGLERARRTLIGRLYWREPRDKGTEGDNRVRSVPRPGRILSASDCCTPSPSCAP